MPVVEKVNADGIRSLSGHADTTTVAEASARLREVEAASPWLAHKRPGGVLVVVPPPLPAPPRPNMESLRAALRKAHAERDQRKAAAEKASAADQRATAVVAQAEAALAAFAGLDDELAEHHARQIREGEQHGTLVLAAPLALAERLKARTECEQRLAEAGRARALLAAEAEQARAKLASAEGAVSTAAAAVLMSSAEEIADAFEKAKAEADALLDRLRGMAAIWSNGAPLQLSPRLRDTISQAGGPRHDERWSSFMAALRDAPDATFGAV